MVSVLGNVKIDENRSLVCVSRRVDCNGSDVLFCLQSLVCFVYRR